MVTFKTRLDHHSPGLKDNAFPTGQPQEQSIPINSQEQVEITSRSPTFLAESEGAIVISCGSVTSEQVILRIIGVESPPDNTTEVSHNFKKFPWSFETKYYSADIDIFAVKKKEELNPALAEKTRAVVFYFDGQEVSGFDEVVSWMPLIKDIKAEVQLMVCNNSCDDPNYSELRKKFLDWCIKNQYELIELNPSPDSDDEDDVKYAKGYDRVIEALQTHPWSNLIQKTSSQQNNSSSTKLEDIKPECISEESGAAAKSESKKHVVVEGEDVSLDEALLSNVLSGEDPGGESLEALFGKFASMKDRANGLTGAERKKYAEEVAIAFWKAMGGDEDEIGDLDDLED
ncbi:hypothetical protein JTE90_000767 [Oedothorax gibbosus]|uniref:Alpha-and gamma-adaptin-binding protein p34 n=1 Tax=Oedothorax gibbosus TaxID=931172 RepID=A0AAV6UNI4_9ARAC|nr:hypothetical protein JTE90_000767 [Oedothorax gibbosus]